MSTDMQTVVEAHYEGLFAFALSLSGNRDDACELTQEAFWQGHKVSLICFKLAGGETVHLFTLDRRALRDAPPTGPEFAVAGRYAVAGWTSGDAVYLVATSRDESILRKIL